MEPKSAKQRFMEEGYFVFPKLLNEKETAELRAAVEFIRDSLYEDFDRRNPGKDTIVFRHLNNPVWSKDRPEYCRRIMELAADPRCLGPVEQIFEGPSLFRTTSLMVPSRYKSTDGNWHRDWQFMVRDPEKEKAVILRLRRERLVSGVQFQIALVDNDDLEYIPYSAGRYDTEEEFYVRLADNWSHATEPLPNSIRLKLKAGDAALINATGLHRGRYHTDIPRLTLMFTYTPKSMPYYDYLVDQPFCLEPGYLDGLSLRAKAYFTEFIETYRDYWTANEEQKKAFHELNYDRTLLGV